MGCACIRDDLRLGARVEDQVDGGGKSPTNDCGRSSSVVGAGGGVEILESCFSAVLVDALRFGSLCIVLRRFRGDAFRGGDENAWTVAGDSAITDCRGFAGDVFNAGSACPLC